MSDIDGRFDRLESRLEQHQETITEQRERIAELDDEHVDADRTTTAAKRARARPTRVTRRGALTVSGLLALVFGGVGTASAAPQGQLGTAEKPVETAYTATLDGPLTGGTELTSLVGDGLTVENGTLTTDGGY